MRATPGEGGVKGRAPQKVLVTQAARACYFWRSLGFNLSGRIVSGHARVASVA